MNAVSLDSNALRDSWSTSESMPIINTLSRQISNLRWRTAKRIGDIKSDTPTQQTHSEQDEQGETMPLDWKVSRPGWVTNL
jgi:hypothetical protein